MSVFSEPVDMRQLLLQALRLSATSLSQSGSAEPDSAWLLDRLRRLLPLDQHYDEQLLDSARDLTPSRVQTTQWLLEKLFISQRGLPRLGMKLEDASAIMRQVDLDSLLCLHPELLLGGVEDCGWNSICHRDSTAGSSAARDESIESHIHLGGALSPSFYWIRLLGGSLSFRRVNDKNFLGRMHHSQRTTTVADFDVAGSLGWCLAARLWLLRHLARGCCRNCSDRSSVKAKPDLQRVRARVFDDTGSTADASTWGQAGVDWLETAVTEGYQTFRPGNLLRSFELLERLRHFNRQNLLLSSMEKGEHRWAMADPIACLFSKAQTSQVHYAAGERMLLNRLAPELRLPHPQRCKQLEHTLMDYLALKNNFHQRLANNSDYDGLLGFTRNFDRRRAVGISSRYRAVSSQADRDEQRRGRIQRNRHLQDNHYFERDRMSCALQDQLYFAFEADNLARRRLEMRVTLPDNHQLLAATMSAWQYGYRDYIEFARRDPLGQPVKAPEHYLGLVAHAIKFGSRSKTQRLARHAAQGLMHWLKEPQRKRQCPFILGFDAAGNERNSSPRDFHDAFLWLRREINSLRVDRDYPIVIQRTFHVGEDIDDLLIGLRHIDETVELLLGPVGGRLGHALALGHNPGRFHDRRSHCRVRRADQLLNLVWAYQFLDEQAPLEMRVRLSDLIVEQLTIIHALLALTWRRSGRINISYLSLSSRHWRGVDDEQIRPPEPENPEQLGRTDETLLAELLRGFAVLNDSAPLSALDPLLKQIVVHDYPKDNLDLETQSYLQQKLVRKIASRHICIEANPTSNLLIGDYRKYSELPYAAWVEQGLSVSINTDDPGLFMTSLPQEYAALHQSHFSEELGTRERDRWLDDRHRDALRYSFFSKQALSKRYRDKLFEKLLAGKPYLKAYHLEKNNYATDENEN